MSQRLSWLLETKQALEIIPGVLYFASIGEKLPSLGEAIRPATPSVKVTTCRKRVTKKKKDVPMEHIEVAAATLALEVSLNDVTVPPLSAQKSGANTPALSQRPDSQSSPRRQREDRLASSGTRQASPSFLHRVRSAAAQSLLLHRQLFQLSGNDKETGAVLQDGAFLFSVSESPFFQYHPFFADFGPLDLGHLTLLSQRLEGMLEHCAGYAWSGTGSDAVFGPGMDGRHSPISGKQIDSNRNECTNAERSIPSLGSLFTDGEETIQSGAAQSRGTERHRISKPIPIVFCSRLDNHDRANMACLLACFCVATLRWSVPMTWRLFQRAYPPFIPFRDASYGVSTYPLTLLDIISGLEKAIALGWYNVRSFDVAEFDRLRRFDCSWVVPQVFMAFSSPETDKPNRQVEEYAKLFKQLHITHVVRLNDALYKREKFLANGVRHVELEFPDGTAPNDDIVTRFMRAVEPVLKPSQPHGRTCYTGIGETVSCSSKHHYFPDSCSPVPWHLHDYQRPPKKDPSHSSSSSSSTLPNHESRKSESVESRSCNAIARAVAVHCRAGLGRTGTLICVYMMQVYGLTARESIGWIRLCRPGSVMGVQQQFLETIERRLGRPTKESDILRSTYHMGVIGSGVVDGVSSYAYQQHGLRVSVPRGSGHRLAMAELEAMISDARYVPQRSQPQSLKYPSSYFLALESADPAQGAFALQNRFAMRRLQARQSDADAPIELVPRRLTSNSNSNSNSNNNSMAESGRRTAPRARSPPRARAMLLGSCCSYPNSATMGTGGEDIAAVSAAARRLPPAQEAVESTRRPATLRQTAKVSFPARRLSAEADPGWGAPAVRLGGI